VDASLTAKTEKIPSRWQSPVFTVLALLCFALVLLLNYLKAMRWAGVMNAESSGYMLGGVLISIVLGLVVMYLLERKRTKKNHFGAKALLSMGIALLISVFTLASEKSRPRPEAESDTNHQLGSLLKEAAGKQPRGKDANWSDAPLRDIFQDVLEMNQHYATEVAALDKSAIRDLYSSKSYGGEVHMRKVIAQLRETLAVDEKYASVDPLIKRMEDRVRAADAPDSEKQDFLKGVHESVQQSLGPRQELFRKEEAWVKSTIDLYEFAIAHTPEYSIQEGKIYFNNEMTREKFFSLQSNAIVLHEDYLNAKKSFNELKKAYLGKIGVSEPDLKSSQPGKTQ
jgi:hypothetical protein